MTEPLAVTIADAVKLSGLGRTTLYEAMGRGDLDAVKAGRRTLILVSSLRAYLAKLPRADITTGRTSAV